jgi:hypothetical protein
MSNRKTITEFLGKLLYEEKLCGMGMYWAKEVVVDYGSSKAKTKRIDFMQYIPDGQCSISSLEKGIFICYEVKSCKEDVYSGNGLNFLGEKNYIVTTLECGKELLTDIRSGKLKKYIQEHYPDSSTNFGIMVAVRGAKDGFYDGEITVDSDVNKWYLKTIANCRTVLRRKSMVELLFCMLRAKGD